MLKSERGIAAVIAVLMVGMMTLLGLAALSTSDDEVSIAGNELQEARSFYAAESGLEKAVADIQNQYEVTGLPPTTMPSGTDQLNNCNIAFATTDNGAAVQRVLVSGPLSGLRGLVKTYTVRSSATGLDGASVQLTTNFEAALVPIFQFAVFYEDDLEIAPGPDMTLAGRVHSNGDMYLQSDNSLSINSFVTSAGDILHGRKGPGGTGTGDVRIKDAAGNYISMKSGSTWVDATQSNWYTASMSMWNGRVQDKAHGQAPLALPLAGSGNPHKLIEPAAGNADSYENKATLKIVNNVALQKVAGVWVDVTAAMTASGALKYTADKFTDQREAKPIDLTELDIQKVYAGGFAPPNGVLYFSDNITAGSEFPGLRLVNASTLGAPLTVASANPLYTLGNFNSNTKKPAALMADAITFLSSAFDDAKSAMAKANRVANNTTVNASYLTGNKNTTSAVYNGGFENLPRFLETWSGKDFTWSGSAICLWNSTQAVGTWNGTYYDPPNRIWSYDTDLNDPAKMPPATPSVLTFIRSGWSQQYVGNSE